MYFRFISQINNISGYLKKETGLLFWSALKPDILRMRSHSAEKTMVAIGYRKWASSSFGSKGMDYWLALY